MIKELRKKKRINRDQQYVNKYFIPLYFDASSLYATPSVTILVESSLLILLEEEI